MLYGLIAALGWGISAAAAAIAVRQARTYIVVLFSQGVGLTCLVLLTFVLHPSFDVMTRTVVLGLAAAGAIGMLGYLCFYRAVALGPAGLMSAISATYGGVAAGLAVAVLGERLGAGGTTGVALTVIGIALAAARANDQPDQPGTSSSRMTFSPLAAPFAFGSAITYGLGGFLLADFSKRAGWLLSGLVAHGTSVSILLSAMPLLGRRTAWRDSSSGLGWALAAGLTDVVGLLAYSRGSQVGQVTITAAASSVYPVIPVFVGLAFLGERLSRRQLIGTGTIVAGLVLLGLG